MNSPKRSPEPGERWTLARKNHIGPMQSFGHITNQRGVGFVLHAGTRRQEIDALCRYLDALEKIAATVVDLDTLKWGARR